MAGVERITGAGVGYTGNAYLRLSIALRGVYQQFNGKPGQGVYAECRAFPETGTNGLVWLIINAYNSAGVLLDQSYATGNPASYTWQLLVATLILPASASYYRIWIVPGQEMTTGWWAVDTVYARILIDTAQLKDGAVSGLKIAQQAVDTIHLVDEAVGTNQIAPFAATAAKIGLAAVQQAHIDRGTAYKFQVIDADIDRASINRVVIVDADIQGALTGKSLTFTQNSVRSEVNVFLFNSQYYGYRCYNSTTNADPVMIRPGEIMICQSTSGNTSFYLRAGASINASMSLYDSSAIERERLSLEALQFFSAASSPDMQLFSNSLSFGGNQVVTTRQAAVTLTSKAAGASYTSNEQSMLNEIKQSIADLKSRLDTNGHGLITA